MKQRKNMSCSLGREMSCSLGREMSCSLGRAVFGSILSILTLSSGVYSLYFKGTHGLGAG